MNDNKPFIEQVEKYTFTTFGEITQLFIEAAFKKNPSVLSLTMFYEIIVDNPKKAFRVLSCVIYIIIKHYLCIDYLSCKLYHL